VELLIILGAIVVAILVFGWVFKLIRNTLQMVLFVGFILLVLYFLFGIGPGVIWEQLQNWLGDGRP
jgi:predicted tellurium resistance membrane protein TerC